MATIRRRANGTYQAVVTASGFPHTTRTFHSAEAARVWALFSENELKGWDPGRKQTNPDITLREGLVRYLQEVTVLKKSCDTEARRIAHWCEHPLADRPMRQITGADLSNHRNLRLMMGRSADTVRLELAVVSHLYEVARTDWGLRGLENPRKDMRRMPIGSARTRRLRGGELEILKRHCEERGMMVLWWCIVLAIETAMRRSEMVRLRWEHIDFDDCLAYLDQTKTGTARIVPLSTRAVEAFRCLRRSEDGRVLPHHPDTITYWFVQACKANGIVGLRFHDLRHEATSRLFEMGFNMMEVAAVTGHKSTQMLKRYTHLNPRDIVKRLG